MKLKIKKLIVFTIFISFLLVINEKNKDEEIEDIAQNKSLLQKVKNETNFVLEDNKLLLPCVGVLTSKFGYRNSNNPIVSKNHKGIDIAAPKGTKIIAAHDGIVLKAGNIGSYGKCVILQNTEYITLYAHCSKVFVNEGEKIIKGQKVAEVGMTRKCNWKSSSF